jgi:ribosome-binding factor A
MNRQRLAGIEKEISKVISQVLFEEVKNKKIKGIVSVTKVRVTEDLKFADVYFSILPYAGQQINQESVLEGLNEIKGFLRKRISEKINLRYTPEIRVKLDETIEHAIKISALLNEIKEK